MKGLSWGADIYETFILLWLQPFIPVTTDEWVSLAVWLSFFGASSLRAWLRHAFNQGLTSTELIVIVQLTCRNRVNWNSRKSIDDDNDIYMRTWAIHSSCNNNECYRRVGVVQSMVRSPELDWTRSTLNICCFACLLIAMIGLRNRIVVRI